MTRNRVEFILVFYAYPNSQTCKREFIIMNHTFRPCSPYHPQISSPKLSSQMKHLAHLLQCLLFSQTYTMESPVLGTF